MYNLTLPVFSTFNISFAGGCCPAELRYIKRGVLKLNVLAVRTMPFYIC